MSYYHNDITMMPQIEDGDVRATPRLRNDTLTQAAKKKKLTFKQLSLMAGNVIVMLGSSDLNQRSPQFVVMSCSPVL